MKKHDSKIKEMLIFPYNFSTIKKFDNNIKKINSPNVNFNSKNFNKNYKSNRYIKNNLNLTNRQIYSENNTLRNSVKNSDNNNTTARTKAYSENKIKINLGIIKEIYFLNNV